MFNHAGSQPNTRAEVVHKGSVGDSAFGCLTFGGCSIQKGPDFWKQHHIRRLKHSKEFSSDLRRGRVTSASAKVFTEAFG